MLPSLGHLPSLIAFGAVALGFASQRAVSPRAAGQLTRLTVALCAVGLLTAASLFLANSRALEVLCYGR